MELSLNVLIVEDDNAMAHMCAKLIRRRGHSALIAGSCRDALEIVKRGGEIDAVLSDIQMPQMSGIELLAELRDHSPELPVILMTGYSNLVSSSEALALGAADYLAKPFNAETLIGSLERCFPKRVAEHA
jgi:two-component system response regulator FlrC